MPLSRFASWLLPGHTEAPIQLLSAACARTLPVRIWNSLNLDIEPIIAAVSTLLNLVTVCVLLAGTVLRWRS